MTQEEFRVEFGKDMKSDQLMRNKFPAVVTSDMCARLLRIAKAYRSAAHRTLTYGIEEGSNELSQALQYAGEETIQP